MHQQYQVLIQYKDKMIIYFDCAAVDEQIIDMLIIININTILIIIKINSFNVIMNDVINFEK